jgi:hypothetical protein
LSLRTLGSGELLLPLDDFVDINFKCPSNHGGDKVEGNEITGEFRIWIMYENCIKKVIIQCVQPRKKPGRERGAGTTFLTYHCVNCR